MAPPHATTTDLLAFIEACPTPYHCAEEAARRLIAGGFERLREEDRWQLNPLGRYVLVRGGAVAAFRCGARPASETGFRVIGAHTDSPTLRIKPVPDAKAHGYHQVGVEVYGGVLTHTWLDRDLGLAGRVVVRESGSRAGQAGQAGQAGGVAHVGVKTSIRLIHLRRAVLRIPSLAIHLYPELREEGLKLNPQKHLAPLWALAGGTMVDDRSGGKNDDKSDDKSDVGLLRSTLAQELDVDARDILSWDLSLCDVTKPIVGGLHGDMIFAPRLDNLSMCFASTQALLRAAHGHSAGQDATQVVCLYDHEEVGSESVDGAGGSLAPELLRRLAECEGPGAEPGALPRAMARSFQVSADMAHAVHPNYDEKHEPQHLPRINGGPVIKVNASQRYATSAETAGLFEALCQDAEVPYQKFVNRSDLRCGTTIGPISSARLGIRTVDVGNAMLAMHSIRETAGADDPERMVAVMQRFFDIV